MSAHSRELPCDRDAHPAPSTPSAAPSPVPPVPASPRSFTSLATPVAPSAPLRSMRAPQLTSCMRLLPRLVSRPLLRSILRAGPQRFPLSPTRPPCAAASPSGQSPGRFCGRGAAQSRRAQMCPSVPAPPRPFTRLAPLTLPSPCAPCAPASGPVCPANPAPSLLPPSSLRVSARVRVARLLPSDAAPHLHCAAPSQVRASSVESRAWGYASQLATALHCAGAARAPATPSRLLCGRPPRRTTRTGQKSRRAQMRTTTRRSTVPGALLTLALTTPTSSARTPQCLMSSDVALSNPNRSFFAENAARDSRSPTRAKNLRISAHFHLIAGWLRVYGAE
ncbi:hypothetical protein B0H15DRAFT_139175 [Mycena belliarum]|uniref:Uncharacterized protein n=1 Tax=Mycena belliarum TaxID=1033014 RepID=A0AAD6TRL5_9AGAR|nr:hypothetical protein B0H15DRAFT_139175 [Mycena belliae]